MSLLKKQLKTFQVWSSLLAWLLSAQPKTCALHPPKLPIDSDEWCQVAQFSHYSCIPGGALASVGIWHVGVLVVGAWHAKPVLPPGEAHSFGESVFVGSPVCSMAKATLFSLPSAARRETASPGGNPSNSPPSREGPRSGGE